MPSTLHAALALLLACPAAGAASCEALRLEIEGKIARAGVVDFSVTVVEAGASAPGKVVGQCGQGSKQIVYERPAAGDGRSAPAPGAPASAAKQRSDVVITECKDGSVVRGGDCKK